MKTNDKAIGKLIVEVIPFKNFKEKIKIIKKYEKKYKVEIYKNFIIVWRIK